MISFALRSQPLLSRASAVGYLSQATVYKKKIVTASWGVDFLFKGLDHNCFLKASTLKQRTSLLSRERVAVNYVTVSASKIKINFNIEPRERFFQRFEIFKEAHRQLDCSLKLIPGKSMSEDDVKNRREQILLLAERAHLLEQSAVWLFDINQGKPRAKETLAIIKQFPEIQETVESLPIPDDIDLKNVLVKLRCALHSLELDLHFVVR